jgi:hypothetical protein
MDLKKINKTLLEIGNSLSRKTESVDCFLFGSILTEKFPNDIDILILYRHESQLKAIKSELEEMSVTYPLHVIYLTFLEEKEFDFVTQQKAKLIFRIG